MKKISDQKNLTPLSESDPRMFFNLLSSKLENYLKGEEESKQVSHHSRAALHISVNRARSTLECGDANDFAYESDIDAQLDEHLNRVYNGEGSSDARLNSKRVHDTTNENGSAAFELSQSQLRSMQQSFNKLSVSSSSFRRDDDAMNQHHFYKLTSTSKEFDIDAHHLNQSQSTRSHQDAKSIKSKSNSIVNENNLSTKLLKGTHTLGTECDSGVSMRSANSIERVNDWLSSALKSNSDEKQLKEKVEKAKKPSMAQEPNIKTTVAYYLPGEELAYISTFNGKHLTLAMFKQLITKKGHFRYFFKTKSDLLDEECVVYQEATDEDAFVPMFNNKVIAKIEKIT